MSAALDPEISRAEGTPSSFTSLLKVCTANFKTSINVRYGNNWSVSSFVSTAFKVLLRAGRGKESQARFHKNYRSVRRISRTSGSRAKWVRNSL